MDERETLIVAQACVKAAAEFMAERDGGYAEILAVAGALERWVHEAPKRALTNLTDRVTGTVTPMAAPQPPVQPQEAPSGPSYACQTCGSPMVLRSGPYGQFYGCSTFPACNGTRDIGGRVKTG